MTARRGRSGARLARALALVGTMAPACTKPAPHQRTVPPPPGSSSDAATRLAENEAAASEASAALDARCRELTTPRLVDVGSRVTVALGYDLANVVLVATNAGNVIVDSGADPGRGAAMREALTKRHPGKILALIYTHSHLDHVGGASAWAESGTQIWATTAFSDNFIKQYGMFQPVEQLRGARQFGRGATPALPCSALGPLPDLDAAARTGARLPTREFSGRKTLTFGDVKLELLEAHGETTDTLMVWLESERILIAGDNFYRSFPNLYTIRGTTARPVDEWIRSLDRARALKPVALVPMHTEPVLGDEAVQRALTSYRDAIQWVRDETVRGANSGATVDELVDRIRLPAHLANDANLAETYGRVDWSVRGIYETQLGWFSGTGGELAGMPRAAASGREIELMGGPDAVLSEAETALARGDAPWAAHLLDKLSLSPLSPEMTGRLNKALAAAWRSEAAKSINTNARGYLAAIAAERDGSAPPLPRPGPDERLIDQLPVDLFLNRMVTLLKRQETVDLNETIKITFTDVGRSFYLSVRRGVLEVFESDSPLPGTPAPAATLTLESAAWKRIALGKVTAAAALTLGGIEIDGDAAALARFLGRFDRP
jgi:alkyl sulfatase BDS1-like metallo-beta-lactamase superfamily hydrolase